MEIDIREYKGEKKIQYKIGNVVVNERVDQLPPPDDEIYIAGNDSICFSNVPAILRISEMMADKLKPYKLDCLFMPETRALMTGMEIARILGIEKIAVARKRISPSPPKISEVEISSITSGVKRYQIDGETEEMLAEAKAVGIFDDVISTCKTVKRGLMKLSKMVGARVEVISTVAIEGSTAHKVFENWFRNDRFVYLEALPMWATGETLTNLKEEEAEVRAMYANLPIGRNEPRP